MGIELRSENNQKYFIMLLAFVFLIGTVMVYSSSYMYAKEVMGSSTYLVFRQITFGALGISLAWVVSKTKFSFWYNNAYTFHIVATLIVFATLVTGVGLTFKGANRWLSLGGMTIQPGEFLKYSTLLCATRYFLDFQMNDSQARLKMGTILFLPLVLLVLQPDFGTFSICIMSIGYICFLSPFPRKWFYALGGVGSVAFFIILLSANYRVQRLLVYLDPWRDPKNSGFQIIQSYLAFANGAIFGKGLGNSHEKLFYLPEAYNDFIFSVIGEELGFVGVVAIVVLYIGIIFMGLRLALQSLNDKASLFMVAFVFALGIQVFFNMGVVLGLLPTKGLNLPFISYGGSSLLANFAAIGLFFSAYRAMPDVAMNRPGMGQYRQY